MKKQLLIAAVAATMTSVAIADISITGNAKFEYQNKDTGAAAQINTNKTNSEVNLAIVGKTGGTAVTVKVASNGNGTLVVEDQYMTTTIGDVSVKAGNFASGTSGVLGEIDNGGRSNNKIHFSTELAGMSVYMGNAGNGGASTGFTNINNNMYAGVSAKVGGMTVQAKKVSPTADAFGIAGDLSGVSFRVEEKSNDAANSDVTFASVSTEMNGVTLGYAMIDADQAGLVTENDSSIFAVEMGSAGGAKTNAIGVSQFMAKTAVAGNTVTFKAGTLDHSGTVQDSDFTQIDVKRPLAAGALLAVTYTNADAANVAAGAAMTDTTTFEAELSVKF